MQTCDEVVHVLTALNRHYPPASHKHLADLIEKLEQKPMRLHALITDICSNSLPTALPQARTLVEATLALVDAQGYDTRTARQRYHATRPTNTTAIYLDEDMEDV